MQLVHVALAIVMILVSVLVESLYPKVGALIVAGTAALLIVWRILHEQR